MAEDKKDLPSDQEKSLATRLAQARAQYAPPPDKDKAMMQSGLGRAMLIGIEFFSAVVIAALLGYGVDQFLGSTPFAMIIFFFFGMGAAFLNVYRFVTNMTYDDNVDSNNNP